MRRPRLRPQLRLAVLTAATGAYWPTEGWRTSTPEEQGMDSQKLAEMLAEIRRKEHEHP